MRAKAGWILKPEPETGQLVTLRRRAPCCWPVRPESILRSPEHPALSNLKVSEPRHLQKQLPRSSFSVWSTLIPRNLLLKIFLPWSERYRSFLGQIPVFIHPSQPSNKRVIITPIWKMRTLKFRDLPLLSGIIALNPESTWLETLMASE